MKKLVSIVLALVMLLGLSSNVFATTGPYTDLTMTTTIGTTTYTFSKDTKTVNDVTAYALYATLPTGTDLSALTVTIVYSGSSLKIGTNTVHTNSSGSGTYTGSINITGSVLVIQVGYGSNDYEHYYVSAYTDTNSFASYLYLDSTNAYYFGYLTGNSYTGHLSGCTHYTYLAAVTTTQKNTAKADLAILYGKTSSYNAYAGFLCDVNDNPIDLLSVYATTKGLTLQQSTAWDVICIGVPDNYGGVTGLGVTSTARYTDPDTGWTTYAGGWMYSVTRGSSTAVFPRLAADTFKLMPGDIVKWVYTCDLGYDVLNPMK